MIMIYVCGKCFTIHIQKLDRCLIDPCNEYQLILQHIQSKCITVLYVNDISCNEVRFEFDICLDCKFQTGEYNYFLVSYNEWNNCNVNREIVKNSIIQAEKYPAIANDMFIAVNGELLVFNTFKATLIANGLEVCGKDEIVINQKSDDNNESGLLQKKLCIISNGILKYSEDQFIPKQLSNYKPEKKYKAYEGRR